jgi:hypothetical protein
MEEYLNTKYPRFLQSRNREFSFPSCFSWIESRDEIPFKRGRLWRPRLIINPNRRPTLLTMVKSRSTWVLTSKNSPTNSNDTFDQVDTHVGSTHGHSLGQTPLKP